MVGSGGLVVMNKTTCMVNIAKYFMQFTQNESCGKCVPCRLGSQKMASLGTHLLEGKIEAERWKSELLPLMKDLSKAIELASICGLGRSVPVPLRAVTSFFDSDVTSHLKTNSKPVAQTT